MTERADIAIVGAGAAGLAAAIFAAEASLDGPAPPCILLLDGAASLGAKILVSGGGRCNVTNEAVRAEDFHGTRTVVRHVLAVLSVAEVIGGYQRGGGQHDRRGLRDDHAGVFPAYVFGWRGGPGRGAAWLALPSWRPGPLDPHGMLAPRAADHGEPFGAGQELVAASVAGAGHRYGRQFPARSRALVPGGVPLSCHWPSQVPACPAAMASSSRAMVPSARCSGRHTAQS